MMSGCCNQCQKTLLNCTGFRITGRAGGINEIGYVVRTHFRLLKVGTEGR